MSSSRLFGSRQFRGLPTGRASAYRVLLLVPLPSRTCAEPYRPALTLRKPEDETRKSGRALSILRTEMALSAVVPAPFHVPL
jgi:hypothetical protein